MGWNLVFALKTAYPIRWAKDIVWRHWQTVFHLLIHLLSFDAAIPTFYVLSREKKKKKKEKKGSRSSSFSHLSLFARQNFGQQAKVCCALPTAKKLEPSIALGSQQRGQCFCVSGTPLSGSDSSLLWRKILTHFPGKRSGKWDICRKELPDKKNNKTRQKNNRENRKEKSNYSPEIPHRGVGDSRHNKIIIIMYICHAVIDALSAHMIHININTRVYIHVEHSLTNTI